MTEARRKKEEAEGRAGRGQEDKRGREGGRRGSEQWKEVIKEGRSVVRGEESTEGQEKSDEERGERKNVEKRKEREERLEQGECGLKTASRNENKRKERNL